MEFKGTKGEWKYKVKHRGSTKDALIQVVLPNQKVLGLGRITEDDCTVETCCCTEEHDNAKLIAEAGNVRQQINCSLTELLEQRNELLESLQLLVSANPILKSSNYHEKKLKAIEVINKALK